MIGRFQSIFIQLFVSVFQGSYAVATILIDGTKNAMLVGIKLQSSHVIERRKNILPLEVGLSQIAVKKKVYKIMYM